jgi:glutathione S-transferase
MNIELYYAPQTRSIRPRWLLEELELPYELHQMELFDETMRSREYRRIHPLGQVPAIRIDGEIMIESVAICHWLADQYPDKGLAPTHESPLRRAYEQWMFFLPGTMEPPLMDVLMHTVLLPEQSRVPEILPLASRRYTQALKLLNTELKGRSYLLGEAFSTADIVIGATLNWLPEDLERFEALKNYVQRLSLRPAWQRICNDS